MKKQYNHLINTAHKLSKGRLEAYISDEIFRKHFKTNCLAMSKDSVITVDQLPSGRYQTPTHRVLILTEMIF